jgi:hypothetical protein
MEETKTHMQFHACPHACESACVCLSMLSNRKNKDTSAKALRYAFYYLPKTDIPTERSFKECECEWPRSSPA